MGIRVVQKGSLHTNIYRNPIKQGIPVFPIHIRLALSESHLIIEYKENALLIPHLYLVCIGIIVLAVLIGPVGDIGEVKGYLM